MVLYVHAPLSIERTSYFHSPQHYRAVAIVCDAGVTYIYLFDNICCFPSGLIVKFWACLYLVSRLNTLIVNLLVVVCVSSSRFLSSVKKGVIPYFDGFLKVARSFSHVTDSLGNDASQSSGSVHNSQAGGFESLTIVNSDRTQIVHSHDRSSSVFLVFEHANKLGSYLRGNALELGNSPGRVLCFTGF